MRRLLREIFDKLIELTLCPMTLVAGLYLKVLGLSRLRGGYRRTSLNRKLLKRIGVYPIVDHFYEPLFDDRRLRRSLRENRFCPALDFAEEAQLAFLNRFHFNQELLEFPLHRQDPPHFYYHNGWFEAGDAEVLYSVIRSFKPRRLIEVGGGFSTLIAQAAILRNAREDTDLKCDHMCIEPYSNPWLERHDVHIVRMPVEELDLDLFRSLEKNDLLFLDSSHIIRPQGDVLFAFLEVFPILKAGTLVHVHDIFTPKDYPDEWVRAQILFWNEQYLLEAFLSFNSHYEIVGALNFLKYKHWDNIAARCPILASEPASEPSSFWMRRR